MFADGDLRLLYRPKSGFAAAKMAVLALSVVVIPAYHKTERSSITGFGEDGRGVGYTPSQC
mgnify:CR=1 FL=1